MNVSWDMLLVSAALFGLAALPYFHSKEGKIPRFFAALVATATAFAVASFPGLMALAHRPVSDGLILLVYFLGALAAGVMFYIIVVRRGHKDQVFSRLVGKAGGGSGTPRKTSPRAPHHRAAAATTVAVLFGFLVAFHFGAMIHAAGHGGAQFYHEVTQ